MHTFKNITETEDQPSDNQGWNNRCKDFRQSGHNTLDHVLIALSCGLGCFFGNTLNAWNSCKIIIKIGTSFPIITWNWPAFVKVPLTAGIDSMTLTLAFFSSPRTKRIRVAQWVTAVTFSLPPIAWSRSLASCSNSSHLILLIFVKASLTW